MTLFPLLLLLAAPGTSQDTARYSVVIEGSVIGSLTTTRAGDLVTTHFTYRNNGRGPDLDERFSLAPDGTFTHFEVKGKRTFGATVDESFTIQGGRATWRSDGEEGEAESRGHAMYVPVVSSPEVFARLAGAASRRAGGRIAAWPGGALTAERVRDEVLSAGGRRRRVSLFAVTGLDLEPAYVWLTRDSNARLFAEVYPAWTATIEAGWESAVPELLRLQQESATAITRALSKRLRHPLPEPILIRGARLFDAERAVLLPARDVYVAGGKITVIGEPGSPAQEPGTVIDASGKVLLPGLLDMHVHMSEWAGPLHLAAGVTTVRDLGNDNAVLAELVARLGRDEAVGPTVIAAGLVEGRSEQSLRWGFVVQDLEGVRRAIDWYAQRGYPMVKLYNSFRPEWVPEATAYAHERGLRVGGHVPAFMRAEEVVARGYDELHHVNQLMLNFLVKPGDDTRTLLRFTLVGEKGGDIDPGSEPVQAFLRLLRERGTVADPTVGIFEDAFTMRRGDSSRSMSAVADHLPIVLQRALRRPVMDISDEDAPRYRAAFARALELVGALHRAGIPLVAGTDGWAGFGLHRELELYVQAGISPPEVLRIATWEAARQAGRSSEIGSITPGKRADLVLIDGDPTVDISTLRRVALVVHRGIVYHPAELYEAVGVRPFLTTMHVGRGR